MIKIDLQMQLSHRIIDKRPYKYIALNHIYERIGNYQQR